MWYIFIRVLCGIYSLGLADNKSWLEISEIDRFGGKFTCQSQKRNPRTLLASREHAKS